VVSLSDFLICGVFSYKESDLPRHPCFKVIANSEQPLSTKFCRRLITMEKITPFDPEKHANVPVSFVSTLLRLYQRFF
jgi:hypothetical protein